jgi:hypothetical protein
MVSLASLWLPILVAAVLVFLVSSIIHTALPYHRNDFRRLPDEESGRAALRALNLPPGDYHVPRALSAAEMRSPEFSQKLREGPLAIITVLPSGQVSMKKALLQWFVYCAVIGLFAAYVASRTLQPGEAYLQVFRVAGTVAFCGYGLALAQGSIWLGRSWRTTFKSIFDAVIYGLLTGGAFGWLWPR